MDKMRSFGRGVYQKFFDKYAFCTNARLCFCATFYCVGFLKYHQTANTVTLNKSENVVGNINYSPSCVSSLKRRIQSGLLKLKSVTLNCICCRHCQSLLSWQAILLDAVPSAFRLRSLRRGRGGLSFAWQLFSCSFFGGHHLLSGGFWFCPPYIREWERSKVNPKFIFLKLPSLSKER